MCTSVRFTDPEGNLYFGRNLDWTVGYGQEVFVTQRGFTHPGFMDGAMATRYAVTGMAIAPEGCPLYLDVMNEEGLGVAGLNFPGYASYADEPAEGKVNVPSYAFPLYIASQCKTVDEAEEALKDVLILNKPFNDQYEVALLHWIIADKNRAIVVEQEADGLHVYHDDLDVLANQPSFPYHRENVRSYLACTPEFPADARWREATLSPYGSGAGMRGIPGDYYSPSRFVRAAYLNANYPDQEGEDANVSRLFHTLGGVAMALGAAKVSDGDYEYTLYTSGFSGRTRTYYYSTYEDPRLRAFPMDDVALDGGQMVKAPETL